MTDRAPAPADVEAIAAVMIARRGVLPDSMAADDCRRDAAVIAATLADREARVRGEALREAAAWVAQSGYPIQVAMPDSPMPQALWDALVDHVHADESGEWHGNELDRDEVESWLAYEAGRAIPPGDPEDSCCTCGDPVAGAICHHVRDRADRQEQP